MTTTEDDAAALLVLLLVALARRRKRDATLHRGYVAETHTASQGRES